MRVCQLNDCKNAATFEIIPQETRMGFVKNIWICDNCEIESVEQMEYIAYEWKRKE